MNLQNRIARCDCGREAPSSTDLAFFEYRGEGSTAATSTCKVCRYHELAHERLVELLLLEPALPEGLVEVAAG